VVQLGQVVHGGETIRLGKLDYIHSHNDVNGLGCMYKTQTFRIQREGESYRSTIRKR
jgi:hypothetical protein